MTTSSLTYEQPLNERMRGFLRLENLFHQTGYYAMGDHHWDTRQALTALLEIINLLERTDLKNETTKELERHLERLQSLAQHTHINTNRLDDILISLEDALADLHQPTRIFQPLLDNAFLSSIRQRLTTPGSACSFDLPAFHAWLHLPVAQRQKQLITWLDHLKPLEKGIQLALGLLRESALPENVVAEKGRFERNFNTNPACQLVRLEITSPNGYFPEISASKYCMNVRFLETTENQKPTAIETDIHFLLTCCAF